MRAVGGVKEREKGSPFPLSPPPPPPPSRAHSSTSTSSTSSRRPQADRQAGQAGKEHRTGDGRSDLASRGGQTNTCASQVGKKNSGSRTTRTPHSSAGSPSRPQGPAPKLPAQQHQQPAPAALEACRKSGQRPPRLLGATEFWCKLIDAFRQNAVAAGLLCTVVHATILTPGAYELLIRRRRRIG